MFIRALFVGLVISPAAYAQTLDTPLNPPIVAANSLSALKARQAETTADNNLLGFANAKPETTAAASEVTQKKIIKTQRKTERKSKWGGRNGY